MKKLTSKEIIDVLVGGRPDYDEAECWTDLEDLGLSKEDKKKLGEIRVVHQSQTDNSYDFSDNLEVVWYFKDHNVYIKGGVSDGSYGNGYKLDTWNLERVYPKKVEVTIYE